MEELDKFKKCLQYSYGFIDELYTQNHITKELKDIYYRSNRMILEGYPLTPPNN